MVDASARASSPAPAAESLRSVSSPATARDPPGGGYASKKRKGNDERGDGDDADPSPCKTQAAKGKEKVITADDGQPPPKKKKPLVPQYVDHTYTDYAIVEENDLRLLDENASLLPNPTSSGEAKAREKLKRMSCMPGPMKKNAGGVTQLFPGKLLEVLGRSDLDEIIDWMPHGRAFIVKKPKLFATNVLPRFFKQTKFLSFTRQLNLWGYKRITRGLDAGAYYHELFLRGRAYLAMRMRRQKVKGTGMKLTPNPDGEPNFYNDWPLVPPLNTRRVLPPLPPLPSEEGQAKGMAALSPANTTSGDAAAAALRSHDGAALLPGPLASRADLPDNVLNALKYVSNPTGGGRAATTADYLAFQDQIRRFRGFATTRNNKNSINNNNNNNNNNDNNTNNNSNVITPEGQQTSGSVSSPQKLQRAIPPGRYDEFLLAPGVSPLERTARLCPDLERGRPDVPSNGVGGGDAGCHPREGLQPNDPIHDELSAVIHASRDGRANEVAAANSHHCTFPPQELSANGRLMERLRDLDRNEQVKREDQDVSALRAMLYEDLASQRVAGRVAAAGTPYAPPRAAAAPNAGDFDGFSYPLPQQQQPQPAQMSAPSRETAGRTPPPSGNPSGNKGQPATRRPGYGNDPGVESSVTEALREASHLEELAMAKRAKARSLALAGALQSSYPGVGGVPQSMMTESDALRLQARALPMTTPLNDGGIGGGGYTSFGRPFGRRA